MTPAQVRRKFATIERNQIKWDQAEQDLQTVCTHPNATKKHCSDTGNWDRSLDSYWTEWRCPDCDKRWTTEQK